MMIFIFLILLILLHIYFKSVFNYWKRRGIQGPTAIWFFGTFFQENFFHSREKEFDYFKKYGPVFGTYAGTQKIFNTSDPEHIKQVLNQEHIFQNIGTLISFNDQYLSKSILFQNGPNWKKSRSIMSHYFTSHKLRNLMDHYEMVTNNFIDNVESIRKQTGKNLIDVKALSKNYGIDMIAKVIFAIDLNSFKQKDTEFCKNAMGIGTPSNKIEAILKALLPDSLGQFLGLNLMCIDYSNRLASLFKKIIKERKDSSIKYNDLIEQMQNLIEERNLDIDENTLIGNILLTFFAGVGTVSANVSRIFYLLTENTDVKERLRDEIKRTFSDGITYEKLTECAYLDAVIKESLRIHGSILSIERTAMDNCKIGNYEIEKGTGIFLMVHVAQNNDEYFVEPNLFNPNRFLDKSSANSNKYFWPFSAGNKNCLGMRLALIEMKFLLVKVFLKYDIYKPKNFKLDELNMRRFSELNTLSLCFEEKN